MTVCGYFPSINMYIYRYNIIDNMAVVNPSYARQHLFSILDEVDNGEKYIIESKGNEVMLISKEEYDSLIETLYLLSDPDMQRDIEDARKTPSEDMVTWNA